MAFETFTNKGMQVTSGPMSLSISKDGFAYLNTDTSRALGDNEHIVFLFDGDTGRIGFQPTVEGAEGAYKLTRVGPGRSCTMRKVLQHYGFDIKAIQGKHLVIPEDGIYIIDLNDQYTPEALAEAEAQAAQNLATEVDLTPESVDEPTIALDLTQDDDTNDDDDNDGFAPSNEIVPRVVVAEPVIEADMSAPDTEPEVVAPKRKSRAVQQDNTASRAVPKPKDRKTSNRRQAAAVA